MSIRAGLPLSVQFTSLSASSMPLGTTTSAPSKGRHDGGPHADVADLADHARHIHHITELDRPLEHQDQPGDEVLHHVLQSETDADAERAEDERQLPDLQSGHRKRRQQAQEQTTL